MYFFFYYIFYINYLENINSNLLTKYFSFITLRANTVYTIYTSVAFKMRIYFICAVNGKNYTGTVLFMSSDRMYLTPDVYLDYTLTSRTLEFISNADVFINSILTVVDD